MVFFVCSRSLLHHSAQLFTDTDEKPRNANIPSITSCLLCPLGAYLSLSDQFVAIFLYRKQFTAAIFLVALMSILLLSVS